MSQRRDDGSGELAPPTVAADLYDDQYFLSGCAGSAEWRESGGARLWLLYDAYVQMANVCEGDVVVDIGTGRGELLVAAYRAGAARAVGIEYSSAGVELARTTLQANNVPSQRAEVLLADARQVPLPDGCADVVTFCDVVEHLDPTELAVSLSEARRLLRPGGGLFIHTFPTRTVYDVTYRSLWFLYGRWRRWPKDPRQEYERTMHVNEQTRRRLARTLSVAGFVAVDVTYGDSVYVSFLPGVRAQTLYRVLARNRATRPLAAAHLYARARRPAPIVDSRGSQP